MGIEASRGRAPPRGAVGLERSPSWDWRERFHSALGAAHVLPRDLCGGLPRKIASGQLITAAFVMLPARALRLSEFEGFLVAAAAFAPMVTVAPLGTETPALRVLPPLIATAQMILEFIKGAHHRLLVTLCASASAQVILLAALIPRYGPSGAALSYLKSSGRSPASR